MAQTILDALVVELGLNVDAFTAGQKKAVEQMRDLQNAFKKTATTGADDFAKFAGALTAISNPIQALKAGLTELAKGGQTTRHAVQETFSSADSAHRHLQAMSRRTGDAVRAGGYSAADGVMGLARAGLLAFAAIDGVSKAMKGVYDTAQQLGNLRTNAFAAGMDPTRFSTVTNAIYEGSGGQVSKGEVGSYLARFEQARQGFKYGDPAFTKQLQGYARFLGMDPNAVLTMSQEDLMAAFAGKIQSSLKNGADASYIGGQLDMSPAMVQALGTMGPQGLRRAFTDARSRAPTDKEVEDARQFDVEMAKLGDQLEKMKIDILDPLLPGMTALVKAFEDFAKVIENLMGIFNNVAIPPDALGGDSKPGWGSKIWGTIKPYLPSWMGGGSAPPATGGGNEPPAGSGDLPNNASAPGQYAGMIATSAAKWNVPPELITRMGMAESGFKNGLVSSKGALGVMQFLPSTAAQYGIDPTDPAQAIEGAAHYLHDLYKKYGSWPAAVNHYLGGNAAYDPSYLRNGVPQYAASLEAGSALPSSMGGTEAWGDSRAVGIHNHLGGGGWQKGGATPSAILAQMKSMPAGYFNGKNIILDSGTNGNEMGTVEDTISWLKMQGANVAVVGYGSNYPERNKQLKGMADKYGVPFIGAGENNGVHDSPKGYLDELNRAKATFHTSANTVGSHNVITVNTASDHPLAVGNAVKNAITNMAVYSTSTSMTG